MSPVSSVPPSLEPRSSGPATGEAAAALWARRAERGDVLDDGMLSGRPWAPPMPRWGAGCVAGPPFRMMLPDSADDTAGLGDSEGRVSVEHRRPGREDELECGGRE